MNWIPIEQAKIIPSRRGLLLWIPEWGTVGGGRWDDNRHAKKPRGYWTSDLERLLGTSWQRQNQPTHFAQDVFGPNGELV